MLLYTCIPTAERRTRLGREGDVIVVYTLDRLGRTARSCTSAGYFLGMIAILAHKETASKSRRFTQSWAQPARQTSHGPHLVRKKFKNGRHHPTLANDKRPVQRHFRPDRPCSALKRRLYREVVARLAPFGIPADHVTVVLRESATENWGLRGGHAAYDMNLGFTLQV